MKMFACDCGKMAKWDYVTSTQQKWNPYFCDDCVPRGCSCNNDYDCAEMPIKDTIEWYNSIGAKWEWIEEGVSTRHLDQQGRKLPCCEYWFCEEGFEAPDDAINEYHSSGIEIKTIDR